MDATTRILGGAFCALALLAGAGTAAAQSAKEVYVYNWSDYIDLGILDDFTRETGIQVIYDVYDSNDTLETKLMAGKTGYDVVVPTSPFLAREIKAGVIATLDKAKLPNLKHMDPSIMQRMAAYDPGNAHSVVYLWGTTGIGYNVKKVAERMKDAPVNSLSLIFDPAIVSKFKDCGVMMLDAADEVIPAALRYLGLNPDAKDAETIARAEAVLMKVRPHVRKFHSSQYIEDLANGRICIAFGWSGDVVQAKTRAADAKKSVEVAYGVPKEGALMWFDSFAIPADAPNKDHAHAFINYMMKPEVIARASNAVFYPNANKDADPFVSAEVKEDKSIYPPPDVVKTLFTITPYDQQSQRVLTRAWTRVKRGK
ncbi:MAG: polyamine ABC transporter substrate-binding protein [Alphaproteobacteria bacterium]|nr:polyamine ABC transporter substrate-binding protein [Alphaproteobacteria bacterium]